MSSQVALVDRGRGLQLSTSRITVMDVFYYLNRGSDFDAIRKAMPSLTKAEFDLIASYVEGHREALIEKDRRIDAYHRRCQDELRSKGLYKEIDETIPKEVRLKRLKERIAQKDTEQNSGHAPS